MWTLRRAAKRCHDYRLVAPLAPSTKLNIISKDLDHGEVIYKPVLSVQEKHFSAGGLLFSLPSFQRKFTLVDRSLSSQAGARSGDDEDETEDDFSELESPTVDKEESDDGFSELEAPAVDKEEFEDGFSELESPVVESRENSNDESVSEEELADDEVSVENEIMLSNEEPFLVEGKSSDREVSMSLLNLLLGTQWGSIPSALDKWVEGGHEVTRTVIMMTMIKLQRRKRFSKALQLSEWLEAKKHLSFEERDYAIRVDLIAKEHGLPKAEQYIQKIPKSFQGGGVYQTLLSSCASSGNLKKAEELFSKMKEMNLKLTVYACNQMLYLYKKYNRRKIADILLLMEKEDLKPSIHTYRLLLDVKGRANDIEGMEQVLKAMQDEGTKVDLLTQSLLARHYILAGMNDKAVSILKEAESDKNSMDKQGIKYLLPLYALLGKSEDVVRIWGTCKANPQYDESIAAIESFGKLKMVEKAEEVFENMFKKYKSLSTKNYTVLLKVYADNKLLVKGKNLVRRMSDNGCKIGPYSLHSIVKLYVDNGEIEKAHSILQRAIEQQKLKPLFNTYISILGKCSSNGDIHNAEKIFHRLRQSGYGSRMIQYEMLLQTYINAKAPAYGFRERLKADNMYPNKVLVAQLAQVDAFKKTPISDLLD